jgi:hypothetical protein
VKKKMGISNQCKLVFRFLILACKRYYITPYKVCNNITKTNKIKCSLFKRAQAFEDTSGELLTLPH